MRKTGDEFFEFARDHAKETFDKHGNHQPIFLIDGPRGTVVVLAQFGDLEEKLASIAAVKRVAREHGADRVIFVVEAWMSADPACEQPSKDPKREEIIWVTMQTKVAGENDRAGFYRIERKVNSRPRAVDFQEGYGHTTGRFEGLVGERVLH